MNDGVKMSRKSLGHTGIVTEVTVCVVIFSDVYTRHASLTDQRFNNNVSSVYNVHPCTDSFLGRLCVAGNWTGRVHVEQLGSSNRAGTGRIFGDSVTVTLKCSSGRSVALKLGRERLVFHENLPVPTTEFPASSYFLQTTERSVALTFVVSFFFLVGISCTEFLAILVALGSSLREDSVTISYYEMRDGPRAFVTRDCISRREKVRVYKQSLQGDRSGHLQHQILLLHRIHFDGGTGSR